MRFARLLSFFIIIFLILITFTSYSFAKKAAIIIDSETQEVLFQVNADTLNYPASLAKMMTIYIVFDYLDKKKINWNTMMQVSKNASQQPRSKLYLEEGSSISINDAVKAIIIKSSNDVATVVAEHISGSERKFAKLMTRYAREIGMSKTTFKNASGLPNRAQLTTARDMSVLSNALIKNFPKKYKLFNEKYFKWKGKKFKTHNHLMLKYEGADGIKTGYIGASGFQLAFSAIRNNKRLIGIYFGGNTAKQRDQSLTFLMDKEFGELQEKNIIKKNNNNLYTSGKFKIVVGTFKYKKNAEKQIKLIQKKYPKTTKNKEAKIVKIKTGNNFLYETRFQFFNKVDAKIACSRLKKYNRDCFIRG